MQFQSNHPGKWQVEKLSKYQLRQENDKSAEKDNICVVKHVTEPCNPDKVKFTN